MDSNRFDALARGIGAHRSRRDAVKSLVAGLVGLGVARGASAQITAERLTCGQSCSRDADCNSGLRCSAGSNNRICVAILDSETRCNHNRDCDLPYERCNNNRRRCVNVNNCSRCRDNTDCPTGEICRNGNCGECRRDRQCGRNEVCRNGRCKRNRNACRNNKDCPKNKRCRNGRCKRRN